MVRQLKYHESKLLRKTDFVNWKQDGGHRDKAVMRRYMIQKPADYHAYQRLVGSLRQLAHRLSLLPPDSACRKRHEELLLNKLYDQGLLPSPNTLLSRVEKDLTVSAFARRRLPVVMTRLRMAETVQAATKFIEQGHVRVGTDTITDPAFFVTRTMEDFVTWTVGSKIKKNIMKYRDQLDDFELL
jgi:U3 small nucleolar ribonucleoprotein protein IMP3